MDDNTEAVAILLLLPRVTCHQSKSVYVCKCLVVVSEELECMLIAKPGTAVSTAIVSADTLQLSLVSIVCTIGTLEMIERVVGIQHKTIDNIQRSLGNELLTLPDVLSSVLIDERPRVVVL